MPPPFPSLERSLSLRGAVTLNLLDMIGVGPFLTLPLLLAAMGGPQAMLGWVLGALLAVCDGLVWAELGAALPEAGGTYAYLRRMYPEPWGRLLSFLFVFQLCFSAPLSVASGAIGVAQYSTALATGTGQEWLRIGSLRAAKLWRYTAGVSLGPSTLVAMAVVGITTALLYRRLHALRWISAALLGMVLLTIGWTIATGLLRGNWSELVAFAPSAFRLNGAFFTGLGSAMLVATYDYWGYYNVTFLGGEVRDPARTVPRAVLLSIAIVALLYLGLNASVLAVLGAPAMLATQNVEARRALLAEVMRVAYTPVFGTIVAGWLGKLAALLVMVTAFGSVFSLLLGYSRIPFAAARDGNFFSAFGRLHPKGRFPHVSLLVLAGVACMACCLSLADVIAGLVVLRILLQFCLQHAGVMLWRKREPDAARPFRMWFYPLPPVAALVGFVFIVVSRPNFGREVVLAAVIAGTGLILGFNRWNRTASAASKEGAQSVL